MLEAELDFRACEFWDSDSEANRRLYDLTLNGVMIDPNRDAQPIPWDASVSVENGFLRLSGGAGPHGFGSCEVLIPLKDSPYYRIYVEVEEKDLDAVIAILAEQDVRIREIK